jgi:hypothetical protein
LPDKSGYLALWRRFFRHPFWKEKRKFSRAEAWIDILASANFDKEPRRELIRGQLHIVEYGECVMSTRYCAKRWGWTQSAVSRFFKLLTGNLEQIALKPNQSSNHIIIINFEKYDPKRLTRDSDATQTRLRRDSRATQSKELKELKELKYKSDSDELRLAEYLFKYIQRNNPEAKEPNFQKWAHDFNKAIRIDKRSVEKLKDLIKFSQNDSFWHRNILSASKLREKYDKLILDYNSEKKSGGTPQPRTYSQCQDLERRQMAKATLEYMEGCHDGEIDGKDRTGGTECVEHSSDGQENA